MSNQAVAGTGSLSEAGEAKTVIGRMGLRGGRGGVEGRKSGQDGKGSVKEGR